MRKLILVLVVLSVIFVGVDRVAVYVAQSAIEKRVSDNVGAHVQARIHGFPFLLQVARRKLGDVTLRGDHIRLGAGIGVRNITADVRDVDVHDVQDPVAGTMVVDGEVPFADVSRSLGQPVGALTAAGADRVRYTKVVSLAGVARTATILASVSVAGGMLLIAPAAVVVRGATLPPQVLALIKSAARVSYPISGLPSGATLQTRGVTATGFLVRITAHDFSLG